MTDAGAAREWDVVVPDDDTELVALLRRNGVRPGIHLHVSIISEEPEELPLFIGSFRSGQSDLAERSSEILRAEFPGG